jgi:hypothetical protein
MPQIKKKFKNHCKKNHIKYESHPVQILGKFEYGYQNNSEFYADLESVEKNAKN